MGREAAEREHLFVEPAFQSACPDCPAARRDVFAELVGINRGECAFACPVVDARAPLPERWFEHYGVGLVRRGVLVRQRTDRHGRTAAIDAAGPGAVFPLREEPDHTSTAMGYAATRILVCLVPRSRLDAALAENVEAALDLVRLQSEALVRMERIHESRGRATANSRVAALLCALADTLAPAQRREEITGLQQRDLAALLGMRHETVCRALTDLEKARLVVRTSEGVLISNREELEAA